MPFLRAIFFSVPQLVVLLVGAFVVLALDVLETLEEWLREFAEKLSEEAKP